MLHRARDARKVSVCAADEIFRDIRTILPRPGHSRDKAQTTGTVPAIPGRLATMYTANKHWHICNTFVATHACHALYGIPKPVYYFT